jgi:hypothetical protein
LWLRPLQLHPALSKLGVVTGGAATTPRYQNHAGSSVATLGSGPGGLVKNKKYHKEEDTLKQRI